MKKVLSIVMLLALCVGTMYGATTLTLNATASPTNGGTMKATGGYVKYSIGWFKINYSWESQSYSSSDGVLTAYGKNECDGIAGYAASDMDVKIDNITATANKGFYFSKWEEIDASGKAINTNVISNPFSLTHKKSAGNRTVMYRAVFLSNVEVPDQVKMVVYDTEIDDATITLSSVHNRTSLTITLTGSNAGSFRLGKENTTSIDQTSLTYNSTDGLASNVDYKNLKFQLSYVGDGSYSPDEALAATGVNVTITDNEGSSWNIPIVMSEPETYTFLGVENGTYDVDFTNRTDIIGVANNAEHEVELKTEDYTIKLTAHPAEDYELFGWIKITKDENGDDKAPEYFSYLAETGDVDLGGTATIYPLFIPKTQATFIIKEDSKKTPYIDLQQALEVAKNTEGYSIVVFAKNDATLSPRYDENGTIVPYEIPTGVTLLIPGDAAYTCSNGKLTKQDVAINGVTTTPKCYSKLSVADGTIFDIRGKLYLYANIRHDNVAGQPIVYGQMHLGKNVKMTVYQGAELYSYGFITGDFSVNDGKLSKDAPEIIAKDGANIHELFQFMDWRGGNAALSMNSDKERYKVFPVKQYYVQTIEVPLTLEQGSTEQFLTAVEASSEIAVATSNLIVPGSSGGLFCAQENSDVTKYYDVSQDRLIIILEPHDENSGARATFGNISLSFKMVITVTLNSSDFVLPINNNIDVIVKKGVEFTSNCDMEFLAGSTLTIEEGASLLIGSQARTFIYDADENEITVEGKSVGFYGQLNNQLIPINYTPSNPSVASKRTSVTDAVIRVNGEMKIENGSALNTTAGGAMITSDGGGKVYEQNTSTYTDGMKKLYEAYQVNNTIGSWPTIPTTPAKLYNSDGSYVETSKVYPATYTYYITNEETKAGVWSLPPASVNTESWSGTTITATMPDRATQMTVTCEVANVSQEDFANAFTASLDNPCFAFATNGNFKESISLEGNKLSIRINYTPQYNTEEEQVATLTLVNATVPTEDYTYSTQLKATESYSPYFEIKNPLDDNVATEIILPQVNIGETSTKENAFAIVPDASTVAALTPEQGLVWSYSIEDDNGNVLTEFKINDGTLSALENNTITYTPTISGTRHATLKITSTYTPKKGNAVSCDKTVTLTGTSLTVNTLVFDMPSKIYVTDQAVLVKFKDVINEQTPITVTLLDENNTNEAGEQIAELLHDEITGQYTINALNIGTFTINGEQAEGGTISSAKFSKSIEVQKRTPEPKWNWDVLYGNQTYTLPFDPATVEEGEWTLVKNQDEKNLLDYDEENKIVTVHNISTQTSASFLLNQNETHDYLPVVDKSFGVIINPDPRMLPITITDDDQFDIIEYDRSEGVTCQLAYITIPAGEYVVLQFIGMPGVISLTSSSDLGALSIEEGVVGAENTTWYELTKIEDANSWSFMSYSPAQFVKITNTGETAITINSGLTITSYGDETQRNVYYAKVSAIANPENVGSVAVQGGYISGTTNMEESNVFAPEQEDLTYSSSAVGYYHLLQGAESMYMIFNLYAKSSIDGYYFDSWSSVGHTLTTEELKWASRISNYELPITAENVSDMYLGYMYSTYKSIYKKLHPEYFDPETGEALMSDAYINAGALALIPATQVGTWQANFALAEVVSAEDAVWDEVTSPNASNVVEHAVVFNILGDDKNDFVATIDEGSGFSFTEDDITLSTTYNTYTINVSYVPQDIHGTHTATLTLSRVAIEGVNETSSKTATLTVTENLTPSFTLAGGAFGEGTLGQESIIDVVPADKNKVAQVLDPAKLKWTALLSENAPFEIVSIAEDGTCKVRYFRTESGDKSATLTITATYTDSKGTQIPFATTCTLTGSSTADKAANTLALKQDIVLYVDDEPISPFSVNDANNTTPIIITLPEGCTALVVKDGMIKPSGDFSTGTFTITATQEANAYFQASGSLPTTVTVKKHTPEVTWNWTDLYFGQTYTVPVTTNSDGARTITPTSGNTNLVDYVSATETVTVDPLTEGEYEVVFSVTIAESNTFEVRTQEYKATLYKDPRHVRVDVNTELTYRAVTIADRTGENVSFSNGGIHFKDVAGSEYESRQWTMYFIGVPDQLFFTPSGNNAWEIRESSNGSNWRTTFASSKLPAGEQFAMSLSPNTTHVRIVYATNADAPSNGVLNSFYITALEGVKANVDGLYMPIAADVVNNPTTKQLVLQYTSQEKLTISTSDPQFTVDVTELPALNVDKYSEKTVVVTSKATQEKEGRIYVKNATGDILLELPIYTFNFPQTLPIQLATDEPQRFYYVTTATSYAKWNMNTHVVTLQNAPANTTRSLTFAFDGAPTLIRFNHTAADRGTWTICESANNSDWNDADPATRVVNGNEIEQGLLSTTRYVQVVYTSPYSEKVEVTNLIIVGDASVTTDVNVLEFTETQPTSTLNVTAINLADFNVQIDNEHFTVTSLDKSALTGTGIVDVPVGITWTPTAAVEYATLTIVNPNNDNAVLATVELVGKKQSISGPTHIGIYTGLAENITKLNGTFEGTERRPVDLTNAFDADTQTKALFDYLLIYGETSTMDGSTIITTPTNQRGSNAKTPCYIYQREGDTYKLLKVVDNVNDQDKAWSGAIPVPVSNIPTRVYITGFAPYASTGYTKEEEGVWCFRGQAGSKLDVYLEDSYIYSRYKTIDGHSFIDRDNGESFAEQYARGSGGVLVFECSSVGNKDNPFEVNIHTMDRNLLKSHYGCFLSSIVGRAFQVSSPIQVHLISTDITATTHLSFDDIWPTAITRTTTDGVVTAEEVSTKRTNGFISLQKQVNNAPSIDLGSPETVVNFNGGQVELQNAQNVSDNYKTTLAISYRGGKFAGYFLAHGVGSDEVTGTVNFNDGTTTVIPMTVDERYRQYYLMDEDEHGNELNITSCLRCPQNTYVYGGSHCMMRACNEPTSKGGAPWSHAGEGAVRLGMYKYPYASYTTGEGDDAVTHAGGWTVIEGGNGLVSIPADYVPNIKVGDQVARQYGVASVMPNDNGTPDIAEDDYLNFWVPAGYDDSVTPEVDLKVSYWKAAMTKIKAEYASYGGEVGGNIRIGDDTEVETELVYNLLYCVLDNDIRQVISAKEIIDGKEVYKYAAPVKHPAAAGYLEVRPSEVGTDPVNYVENKNPYEVQNRVYYITPIASADNWMTFTAPFDVENIYVVETYDENVLATQGNKAEIKIKQAEHNADFAAFFGVALALGSDRDFDDIYANYIGWAKLQDVGKYTGQYNLRGKHELEYYDGTNWSTANYYLYENQGTWTVNADGVTFETKWALPDVSDEILMNKGESYSLLFPYCTGCWEYDEDGNFIERTMWDYWSGKFVIFESTLRSEENPHVIDGVNTAQAYVETHTPAVSEAYVLGNTSFGDLRVTNEYLYQYVSKDPLYEKFNPVGNVTTAIQPTSSFLLANITAPEGQMVTSIRRTGEIIYGGTSGHIPTVGGGNDLFITTIEAGINVAVATPQHVRVLSSTGAVIYSGMIQTALDIPLPCVGVYVVSGENEVQKVLY